MTHGFMVIVLFLINHLPPLNAAVYTFTFYTGHTVGAGSDARLYTKIEGTKGSETVWFDGGNRNILENGQTDAFSVDTDYGAIYRVAVGNDGTGWGASWLFSKLVINDHLRNQVLLQQCDCWIPDGVAESSKVFPENIDECSSTPCLNGATCNDGSQQYSCVCTSEWTGTHCETDVDECLTSPCGNSGVCTNQSPGFTCDCPTGFTGSRCETDMNPCANSSLCQNGGTCNSTGSSFNCSCSEGFTGEYCENDINECIGEILCQNNATCENNHGSYKCNCSSGYSGDHCETDINECIVQNPCQNNSTCDNNPGSYTCTCLTGYSGLNCETDVDECASNPCSSGATCRDGISSYTCDCPPGYSGEACVMTTAAAEETTADQKFQTTEAVLNSLTSSDSVEETTQNSWPSFEGTTRSMGAVSTSSEETTPTSSPDEKIIKITSIKLSSFGTPPTLRHLNNTIESTTIPPLQDNTESRQFRSQSILLLCTLFSYLYTILVILITVE